MKFDATIQPDNLRDVPEIVRASERIGFDGLWTYETAHDGFLPLAIVAERSDTLEMGTSIALAFTRSPMVLAYIAWDLARSSNGRFILGLGTQVKAHIERRFGVEWGQPVERLRDVVNALRAIWQSWATGERLNYRGEFVQLSLMTPFFTPPPLDEVPIPIYLAGVNTGLCRLAGEVADGFLVHPLHSVAYLRDIIRPAIQEGTTETGRSLTDVKVSSSIFVATGDDDRTLTEQREWVRQQISFYASTPSYRSVLAHHGWGDVADKLRHLAARKKWDQMAELVTDEMVETFAVVAPPDQLAEAVMARYEGLLDRLSYYVPFAPGENDELWYMAVETFKSAESDVPHT